MPKGMGRVRPRRPLSPSVTDTQRYAVPHSTCDSASVIMRKPRPVARSVIQPNAHATSVVPSSATGAVSQWPRPSFSDIHAEMYAASPSLNLLVGYGGLPSLGHASWLVRLT